MVKRKMRAPRGGSTRSAATSSASGPRIWESSLAKVVLGDALACYEDWPSPTVIFSDGAYGVSGFKGDTPDHQDIAAWYEPHIKAWSQRATAQTTLWFWNSEIGWAVTHPVLERFGWRYVSCNVWDKGMAHVAGNVNSKTIRKFPIVTEVCAHYVWEPTIEGKSLKAWLLSEWDRSGLARKRANDACGVKDAATRKYLDQSHLWYPPPADMFDKLVAYANTYGAPEGKPYFSRDGSSPLSGEVWTSLRAPFRCPHGVTNVWSRRTLRGEERILTEEGKALHPNQKPLDLCSMLLEASSDAGSVVWEPFGGLFSGCVAAVRLGRRAFGSEIQDVYFSAGAKRLQIEDSGAKRLQIEDSGDSLEGVPIENLQGCV